MVIHHKPVMVDEVVTALQPRPEGRYIDCTTGEGGHSEAILGHCDPPARLLGLDLDREALAVAEERLSRFHETTRLVETTYVNIAEIAASHGFLPCDGALFDLGVSSLQLNSGSRGSSTGWGRSGGRGESPGRSSERDRSKRRSSWRTRWPERSDGGAVAGGRFTRRPGPSRRSESR